MSKICNIFEKLYEIISEGGQTSYISLLSTSSSDNDNNFEQTPNKTSATILKHFIHEIIEQIDELSVCITKNEMVLISVKNQKILRTSFQLIISLGLSRCLIPGLGISLDKRCMTANLLPSITLSDEQKYELLINITDFFNRSYNVPVLKNLIITFHLSDYIAALIQLSFAPLKKPGTYKNFVMTTEMYENLLKNRAIYLEVYGNLVSNCFQPILMKELLILQGASNPCAPTFVKKVISKELSRRLLMPDGLLSLIRCFIENYGIDSGYDWKKVDLICKIISAKHGTISDNEYISNICDQLQKLLKLDNIHYLTTAVACINCLHEKYPQSDLVKKLLNDIFQNFASEYISSKCNLPGTIVLTSQEIEHHISILYTSICAANLSWPNEFLISNLFILYLIGLKCNKPEHLKNKVDAIVLKILESCDGNILHNIINELLFGITNCINFILEEHETGLIMKCVNNYFVYPKEEALSYFIYIIKNCTNGVFVYNIFKTLLKVLLDVTIKRSNRNNEELLSIEDDPEILTEIDQQYASTLHLLTEMATLPKIITSIKENPDGITNFIEYFLIKNHESSDECVTVALILLNTILSSSQNSSVTHFGTLIPILKEMEKDTSNFNYILSKESLSLINFDASPKSDTPYALAITDVFDNLLPVRAHGMIELTKLIEAKDPETLSRKHYIFCLLQEQLKDPDSYIYLSAINAISSLATHCTDDVLNVLCKEFLNMSSQSDVYTNENQAKVTELRIKIGDIIVKVTRKLGEMAIMHKTILLNTILCGCRDDDPFVRASALSNLAEICLVLNYRLGTILYEILLCVWSTIESDKAIECRRAAVMVISSLVKGLGKDTLLQLKENLLPLYRTLKRLYNDHNEDVILKLHAQLALEELNDIVKDSLFSQVTMDKTFICNIDDDVKFK